MTARCWAILDEKNLNFIAGKREFIRQEVASLTKIMTCYTTIKLCKLLNIDPRNTYVKATDVAADICGTTANLKKDEELSIHELLFGLMLPSGNDAAFALSQYFGQRLYNEVYS